MVHRGNLVARQGSGPKGVLLTEAVLPRNEYRGRQR